jgi:hypothetical protein
MNQSIPFLSALSVFAVADAGASHQIYSPNIEAGEIALEVSSHHLQDSDDELYGQWEHIVDLEYAPVPWWRTELSGAIAHGEGNSAEFMAVEWENIFRVTKPGAHWLDACIAVEFSHALEDAGHDAIEIGALLEKPVGRTTTTLNFMVERELGGDGEIELQYAARVARRGSARLFPALEAFGEFEEDAHFVGPAAIGALRMGEDLALRYEAAFLRGIGEDAAAGCCGCRSRWSSRAHRHPPSAPCQAHQKKSPAEAGLS